MNTVIYNYIGYASNITNGPSGVTPHGELIVVSSNANAYAYQMFTPYNSNDLYIRNYASGTFDVWRKVELAYTETGEVAYASGFKNYDDNVNNGLKYWRNGNVVTINGIVTPTTEASPGAVFATLPSSIRPGRNLYSVQTANGQNKWQLGCFSNGNLQIRRYGIDTESSNIPAGTWLPFTFTYVI